MVIYIMPKMLPIQLNFFLTWNFPLSIAWSPLNHLHMWLWRNTSFFLFSFKSIWEICGKSLWKSGVWFQIRGPIIGEDAAVRETIATFCFPLAHEGVGHEVIKDRAISACRDLGMPLMESAKRTASIMLQTFPISS